MVNRVRKKKIGVGKALLIGFGSLFLFFIVLAVIGSLLPDDYLDDSPNQTQTQTQKITESPQVTPVKESPIAILAKEEIYDAPIKTQIDQRWYVTEVPSDEAALKALVQQLHEQALEPRKEFKHHNPANAVYLYVYSDKETAEITQFGAEWLGMSMMSAADSEEGKSNQIRIHTERLTKQLKEPEVRDGLEESKRRQIYLEWGRGINEALKPAWKENVDGLMELDVDLHDELEQKFLDQLCEKHGITGDQWYNISIEGLAEGFNAE